MGARAFACAAWIGLWITLAGGCAQGLGGPGRDAGALDEDGARPLELADAGVSSDGSPTENGPSPRDGGARADVHAEDAGRDAGEPCSDSICEPVGPQCGCGEGEGCYIEDTGARRCVAAGSRREGDSCESDAECEPGLICSGSETTAGCWRLCYETSDCVGAGSMCRFDVYDDSGEPIDGPQICSRDCVPTTHAGCPSGWACNVGYDTEAGAYYSHCRLVGSAGAYQPCTYVTDCAPGHACEVSPGGDALCYPYCTFPSGAECPTGTTCYESGAILGGVRYGLCGV